MAYPEAVFLVDDEKTEAGKADILTEEAVGPDDEVDFTPGELGDNLLLLGGVAEPAEHLDGDGIGGKTFPEGFEMLLGKHCGWHHEGDLVAVHDGLEGGPDGDFGLAETDIAAKEAVHGPGLFHVAFCILDGLGLVGCLGEGKGIFKGALPCGVVPEGKPGTVSTLGLELEHLGGVIDRGFLGGGTGFIPLVAPEFSEPRGEAGQADVAGEEVGIGKGNVEGDVFGKLD